MRPRRLRLCQPRCRWRAVRIIGFRRTQEMDDPALAAAIAANRFGLGARLGELARVGKDAQGSLTAQFAGGAPRLQGSELRGSADILSAALELRRERRDAGAHGASQTADA